ncbi:MAG: phosphoribosylformylglycinamidine synthase, partial [Flavobacteriaceae bacterium]|nr:phosphoribosylformylglycinamidine synthase [Flavobacteriaceae bacterium]
MILFFGDSSVQVFAVKCNQQLPHPQKEKLSWLFGDQPLIDNTTLSGLFYGPRATMVTPWSTNAVEITQNMGLEGIERIEVYEAKSRVENPDPMLVTSFDTLNQKLFEVDLLPETVQQIKDIAAYNKQEGLALSDEEVSYLEDLASSLKRPLTDSEVFGFSQVNSEHCRHKIFNGQFIIDGEEKEESLFKLIKNTSKLNPNTIVSAYKDNVAFIGGPEIEQFAPQKGDVPSSYKKDTINSVISLKAETHNFPTTVEPFNGAATGSGGEIRDRLAGGQGSIPLAGTAVYMTPYSRVQEDRQQSAFPERKWLYQT